MRRRSYILFFIFLLLLSTQSLIANEHCDFLHTRIKSILKNKIKKELAKGSLDEPAYSFTCNPTEDRYITQSGSIIQKSVIVLVFNESPMSDTSRIASYRTGITELLAGERLKGSFSENRWNGTAYSLQDGSKKKIISRNYYKRLKANATLIEPGKDVKIIVKEKIVPVYVRLKIIKIELLQGKEQYLAPGKKVALEVDLHMKSVGRSGHIYLQPKVVVDSQSLNRISIDEIKIQDKTIQKRPDGTFQIPVKDGKPQLILFRVSVPERMPTGNIFLNLTPVMDGVKNAPIRLLLKKEPPTPWVLYGLSLLATISIIAFLVFYFLKKPVNHANQIYKLRVQNGKKAASEFVLTEQSHILGRIPPEKDGISLPEKRVSRRHLQITRDDKGYFITDLSSSNGTFLNNERLIVGKNYAVQNGDHIRLGDIELLYIVEKK